MRDTDVAPKCAAFREARRDCALAAADYFKIAGGNFEVEMELLVSYVDPRYDKFDADWIQASFSYRF